MLMYQIIKDDEPFSSSLKEILRFIASDSKSRAFTFNSGLFTCINNIPNMPYKYRKSLYHEDEQIRDCIFKGYTIPYIVDEEKKTIVVLDIFKWSKR